MKLLMPDCEREFVTLNLADFRLYILVKFVFGFQKIGS